MSPRGPIFWVILNLQTSQNSGFWTILLKSFLWSYFQRCVEYGPQRSNFWAILDPKVSKNDGLWSLSQRGFSGFISVLLHMLIASTFNCVCNMGFRGPIFGPFWTPKYVKTRGFGHFLKKFSLVSHQYCSTWSLQVLLYMWRIWAS